MIFSKVIEDSISDTGVRLTTIQLRYPRFIHAEFMTHRVFSRNASSSRAIPVAKMLDQVRNEPAMPCHWGKNEPGMQAHAELDPQDAYAVKTYWLSAARDAAKWAEAMQKVGVHKQVANRVLEPFQFMSVIVTATEWANFFELRDHPDAEPNIQALAVAIRQAMDASTPNHRAVAGIIDNERHWHLPYISESERRTVPLETLVKISVARCARVSYLTHDGAEPEVAKDLALYERLVGMRPIHASPTEHQATPLHRANDWCKNFRGWYQFRATVEADAKVIPLN